MLLSDIKSNLTEALKNRDSEKLSTLRLLISEINNFEISHYPPSSKGKIGDEDVLSVIRRQVKTHKESIDLFEKGGRKDLVAKEQKELEILQAYLPKQLSEEEVRGVVKRVIDSGATEFGKIMGTVMKEIAGRMDGTVVSKIVKEELDKK